MKRPNLRFVNQFIVVVSLAVLARAAASADWILISRRGECAPLSSLGRKGPEFRGLQTPYQLVDKMRPAGHQVDVKEHASPNGPMAEVHVPAKEIAVMAVTVAACMAPSR